MIERAGRTVQEVQIQSTSENNSNTAVLPRDKKGRIIWSVLRDQPDFAIAAIENEAAKIISDAGDLTYPILWAKKQSSFGLIIWKLYPGGITKLRTNLMNKTGGKMSSVALIEERPPAETSCESKPLQDEASYDTYGSSEERITPTPAKLQYPCLDKEAVDSLEDDPYNEEFFKSQQTANSIEHQKKPNQYWTVETIEQECRDFIDMEGDINNTLLKRKGRYDLQSAIYQKYPGKMQHLRQQFGFSPNKTHWTEKSTLVQAKEFFEIHGNITKQLLKANHRSDLEGAIRIHRGGLRALKETLGIKEETKPPVCWNSPDGLDRMRILAKEFYEANGTISRKLLVNKGSSHLSSAINRYYPGGWRKLREDIGIGQVKKSRGYWQNIENIEKEALSAYQEFGDISRKVLSKQKRHDLISAIDVYPGGIYAVREKLGIRSAKKPIGFWTTDKIEGEALKFYQEYGYISHDALRKAGMSFLSAAILLHYKGKMQALKENLGITSDYSRDISPEEANADLERLFEII